LGTDGARCGLTTIVAQFIGKTGQLAADCSDHQQRDDDYENPLHAQIVEPRIKDVNRPLTALAHLEVVDDFAELP
jgi:hypothetical protein